MATVPKTCFSTLIRVALIISLHGQPLINPQGVVLVPSPIVMHLGPQVPFPAAGPIFQPFLLVDIPQHAAASLQPPYSSMLNMPTNPLAAQAHMEGKRRRRLLILQRQQQEMHSIQKRKRIQEGMMVRQNTVNRIPLTHHSVNRQAATNLNSFRPRTHTTQQQMANVINNGRVQNGRIRSGAFSPNFGRTPGQSRPSNNNIIVVERRLQHFQPSNSEQSSRQFPEKLNIGPFQNAHTNFAIKREQNSRPFSDLSNVQTDNVGQNSPLTQRLHGVSAAETVEKIQVPVKKEFNKQSNNKRLIKNRLGRQGSRKGNNMRMRGQTFDFRKTNKNKTSKNSGKGFKNKTQQSRAKKRNVINSKNKANKKQQNLKTVKPKGTANAVSKPMPLTPANKRKVNKSAQTLNSETGEKLTRKLESITQTKSTNSLISKEDTKNVDTERNGINDDRKNVVAAGKNTTANYTQPNFASVPQAIKPFSSHVFGHVDRAGLNSDDENAPDHTQASDAQNNDHTHSLNGASVMDLSQTQDFLPPQLAGLGAVDVVTLDSKDFAQLEKAIQTGQPISAGVLNSILGAVEASQLTPVGIHPAKVNHVLLHDTNTTKMHNDSHPKALIENIGAGDFSATGSALALQHHSMHGAVGRVGESVGAIDMENPNDVQGIFTVQSGKPFPNIPASVSSIPSSIGKLLDKHVQRSQQHKHKT